MVPGLSYPPWYPGYTHRCTPVTRAIPTVVHLLPGLYTTLGMRGIRAIHHPGYENYTPPWVYYTLPTLGIPWSVLGRLTVLVNGALTRVAVRGHSGL